MKWRVILSMWVVLAILFGARTVIADTVHDKSINWSKVALDLCGIATWIAFTPALFWLSRRFPLGRENLRRSLLGHLLGMAIIIPLDIGIFVVLDQFVFNPYDPPENFLKHLIVILGHTLPLSVFYYGATIGLSHAFDYYQLVRDRDLRASQLEARLAQSQLQVLRMQLQPHFLFNTLNAISALIHEDPLAADRMITRLSDLLRLTLATQGQQEVRLKEELDLLGSYLEIQQMRFRDRLTIKQEVAPEALDLLVPSLLLQPLVENAIQHGIQPRAGAGHIEIEVRTHDHRLRIEIKDDGRGLRTTGGRFHEGVGLGTTRARLAALYGSNHVFELSSRDGGGAQVVIDIPARIAADESPIAEVAVPT